jgi:prepilin-type N-terminal cleavage/methylation domain-containing protein
MTRRRSAGFTLFELTVALLIMGTMSALAAPAIGEYMSDARATAATDELVRLNRVIRARVNETGLAHLLRFSSTNNAAGSNGLGLIQVWEGMNNHCRQTPWNQTINGTLANGHFALEQLDLANSAYNSKSGSAPSASDTGRQVIRVSATVGGAAVASLLLCFEPGGRTFTAVTDGTAPQVGFTFTDQTAPITFSVTRTYTPSGGSVQARGVVREVVYPVGGNGRFRL